METLFSCRRYPASPLRDSQIIKIVGLPISRFGLRLLVPPIETSSFGLSDAIDVGEFTVAGGFFFNIFGCFVFVTVLVHISQVGLPVLAPIDESDDMIDLSTANRNTKPAITAKIVSSPYNSTFDSLGYRFVMVFLNPFLSGPCHK
jgi:hypothetical protein